MHGYGYSSVVLSRYGNTKFTPATKRIEKFMLVHCIKNCCMLSGHRKLSKGGTKSQS
jgi:hypothetical protein